jgi:hypothetical protein
VLFINPPFYKDSSTARKVTHAYQHYYHKNFYEKVVTFLQLMQSHPTVKQWKLAQALAAEQFLNDF